MGGLGKGGDEPCCDHVGEKGKVAAFAVFGCYGEGLGVGFGGVPGILVGYAGGEGCFVFSRETTVECPSVLDGFGDCFGHGTSKRVMALI